MMKKIFRPFWSFDVKKTEEWLSTMALQGLHFVKIQPFISCFIFESGAPREVQYRIRYDKRHNVSLPGTLLKDGWEKKFTLGNWFILINEKPVDEIRSSPHYEGVVNRNRKVLYIYGGLAGYFILSFILFFAVTMILLFFTDAPVTIEGSPFWFVPILGWGVGFLILYGTIRLYRSNKRVLKSLNRRTADASMNPDHLKGMKRSGELIVKRRFTWRFAPDLLESWLEEMESEGYNLYHISKSGVAFYFKKGEPRRVRYCIDFQNTVNESYFQMHEGSGWRHVYQSRSLWENWNIWGIEYEKGKARPKIYSDKKSQLKHARRMIISQWAYIIPILAMVIYVFFNNPQPFFGGGGIFPWIIWLGLIFGILGNGINVVRALRYYYRVKFNRTGG